MCAAHRIAHFWTKVKKAGPDECWLWQAGVFYNGYGQFNAGRFNGRQNTRPAHRLAYELTNGPIPAGLVVMHTCDEPRCCNPAHLVVGKQADNLADARAKGRLDNTKSRPASWIFPAHLVYACVDAPRGTVAETARKHRLSFQGFAAAVRRERRRQRRGIR